MKIINRELLRKLSDEASKNPRLRQNYNFHDDLDEPCNRLLNAMEPGSYIPPHRHLSPPRPEGFIGVRGRIAVFTFDDSGVVRDIVIFGHQENTIGVDIPAGVWHTAVSLDSGTVFYEVKAGPYTPVSGADLALWAPEAGSEKAVRYLERLVQLALEKLRK